MDTDSAQLIAWLREQPPDVTIEWTTDHLSEESPWCASWVDVRVPAAEEANGTSWSWTVIGPDPGDGDDAEALWEFEIEHDLVVHSVWDPEPPNFWYLNEIVLSKNALLSEEQVLELEQVASEGPSRKRMTEGAWSPQAISRGLKQWATDHAGRTDISFLWNPTLGVSPMLREADEALEQMLSGEDAGYDLGDNVISSTRGMDFLLRLDGETASGVVERLKELAKHHHGEHPDDPA